MNNINERQVSFFDDIDIMHKVEWTAEKVGRFWDNIDALINAKKRANDYFSYNCREEFLRCANRRIHFGNKRIMDYGCGMGLIMESLLKKYKPAIVCGCDLSKESVTIANKRCSKYEKFGGAFTIDEIPNNSFDIIIVMEVIEHMSDKELIFAFDNIKKCLKKGGTVIISTPNDEDLTESIVVCPDCGCYFHRCQHVRSWNDRSLTSFLKKHGFKRVDAVETRFRRITTITGRIHASLYNVLARVLRHKLPNLIYFGEYIGK